MQCHTAVVNAPVPAVGDVFGVYVDFGNMTAQLRIESVALLGEL